jgi:hypothetical protein
MLLNRGQMKQWRKDFLEGIGFQQEEGKQSINPKYIELD